jgi:hypothetical protein
MFFVCFWRDSPQWARASPYPRFLDHTQRSTTVGRTPVDEWSARRRDLYLKTYNTHNRQTSMPPVRFEPTISAGELLQSYALGRAAMWNHLCWCSFYSSHQLSIAPSLFQFVWPLLYICLAYCDLVWFWKDMGFQHRLSYTEARTTVRIRSLFVLNEMYRTACTDTFLFVYVNKKGCYNKECGVEHNLNLSFTLPFATWLLY